MEKGEYLDIKIIRQRHEELKKQHQSIADELGGVPRPRHTDEALALSQCYIAYLESLSGFRDWFNFLTSLTDIRDGDFSSFEGTCLDD